MQAEQMQNSDKNNFLGLYIFSAQLSLSDIIFMSLKNRR
jgi:hypothetical protein